MSDRPDQENISDPPEDLGSFSMSQMEVELIRSYRQRRDELPLIDFGLAGSGPVEESVALGVHAPSPEMPHYGPITLAEWQRLNGTQNRELEGARFQREERPVRAQWRGG